MRVGAALTAPLVQVELEGIEQTAAASGAVVDQQFLDEAGWAQRPTREAEAFADAAQTSPSAISA